MTLVLLGLDTATPLTTVAVVSADMASGSVELLDERSHSDQRRHGEVLPVLVRDALAASRLAPADLQAVAVGVGPGAYTGLRVGMATASALAQSLEIPVFGAVTLDALAYASGRTDPFAVVTDARRRQVFSSSYRDFRTPEGRAEVGTPDTIISALRGRPILALSDTPPLPGAQYEVMLGPSGRSVCEVVVDRLRHDLPTQAVQPLYLRRPDVTASARPKSVL
jgi:tRNA threonylcarbamoyladenosine biosynthesis protein TsaB